MTATRERAINLRDWEVRAQQEGRLKLLVRPVKVNPAKARGGLILKGYLDEYGDSFGGLIVEDGKLWHRNTYESPLPEHDHAYLMPCPFGKPGDRLRGREAWRAKSWSEEGWGEIEYRSDGHVATVEGPWSFTQMYPFDMLPGAWRSAMLMPRWAVRNWLEITEVRCGRVQEMSEEEAIAAGFASTVMMTEDHDDYYGSYAGEHLARQYDTDHGEGAWERDWVWMIGVKRIEGGV